MLERTTRILSEGLARSIDRRGFLKRASQATFAGLAAVAAGQMSTVRASAMSNGGTKPPIAVPSCSPPGPYCNLNGNTQDPNGCHGGGCFQHLYQGTVLQCRVYYQYYQAGCWTTPQGGGYWTCCDCECLNSNGQRMTTCGCAQYSGSPAPRPDNIGGLAGA